MYAGSLNDAQAAEALSQVRPATTDKGIAATGDGAPFAATASATKSASPGTHSTTSKGQSADNAAHNTAAGIIAQIEAASGATKPGGKRAPASSLAGKAEPSAGRLNPRGTGMSPVPIFGGTAAKADRSPRRSRGAVASAVNKVNTATGSQRAVRATSENQPLPGTARDVAAPSGLAGSAAAESTPAAQGAEVPYSLAGGSATATAGTAATTGPTSHAAANPAGAQASHLDEPTAVKLAAVNDPAKSRTETAVAAAESLADNKAQAQHDTLTAAESPGTHAAGTGKHRIQAATLPVGLG